MFKCKNCNSVDKFELMFAQNYSGAREFSQTYTNEGEIVMTVDGYSFKPSLDFMNQHAVCAFCGQIYMWELEGDIQYEK